MMVLSQTAEYALRAVVYLAGRTGTPLTTLQIAERTGVPTSYLAKILLSLTRAGILTSQRGAGGGFVLAELELTILDVVRAVDPGRRCLDDSARPEPLPGCFWKLHRRLAEASVVVEDVLGAVRIAELVTGDLLERHEAS